MPITINGSGSIAGISVGGLENGCVNSDDLATAAVTETKLASNAVTIDKLGTTLQSQVCKAWVNFNGTGTVAIRASYNVSSITDNGVGDYTVNFTNALVDANFSVPGTAWSDGIASGIVGVASLTTSSARIKTDTPGTGNADKVQISIAIFR
jgi:hypothetical protein